MEKFMDVAGIPAMIAVICLFFGIRIMMTKDVSYIMGKHVVTKEPEKFCMAAGKLLIFFAAVNALMGALLFVNTYLAIGEIFIGTVVLGVLWMRMNKKYGVK